MTDPRIQTIRADMALGGDSYLALESLLEDFGAIRSDIATWLVESGYPFDWDTSAVPPSWLVDELAIAWHAKDAAPGETVDDYHFMLIDESRSLRQAAATSDYVYAPPMTRKAKDGYGTRQELLTFARAFRYAIEVEYIDGDEPPLWLRNGYDNAREITGLDRECWPAPWERDSAVTGSCNKMKRALRRARAAEVEA